MKFVPRPLEETADISRSRPNIRTFLSGAFSALLFIGALWLVLGFAADLAADSISEETEVTLFSWIPFGQESDHPGMQRAGPILDRLLETGEVRPLPIRLALWDMGMPNAFAIPGGVVGLTPSLLEEVESEAGLAFVLAHELGHHHFRHTLKGVGRGLLWTFALAVVGASGTGDTLTTGLNLALRARSRAQEEEADAFAIVLVKKTYGSAQGALEFLEIMEENHDSDLPRWGTFFATHPPTPDRLQILRALSE